MSKKFFINHKREFLITYAEDFGGVLTLKKIFDFFSKFGIWEIISCEESGHQNGDKHEHFHVYLNYIGNNKNGFSTREQKIWDIHLWPTAIKLNLGPNYFYVNNELFQLHKNEYVFDSFKEFKYAHPNIKFKGDKDDVNCENTEKMIRYVTKQTLELNKQDWKIYSNFDWEKRLEDIQKNKLEKKKQIY